MRSASLTDKTLGACDRAACRADERAKPMLEAVVEWLATTLDAGTLQSTFGTALLATLAVLACWLRFRPAECCTAPLPAGGALMELPEGHCHYILDGTFNTDGPLVVLVHGFIGSSSYLRFLGSELARTRRVLRFDLYGRGWSAHPRGKAHDAALFASQLASLLFALGETRPVDLVGYSMGGCVAAKVAATFPARVRSLVSGRTLSRTLSSSAAGGFHRAPWLRPPVHRC